MPTNDPIDHLRQHPHTYVIQNIGDEEAARLDLQDRLLTQRMRGLLSEQPAPSRFSRVLDVACGSGRWLIELAQAYPTMTRLVGVDIGTRLVEYAQAQAEAAGVSDRVHFQTGDALRMLDFPDKSFDLVNMRLGMSWLKKWDWPRFLRELQRVARSGGMIRITESAIGTSNSPAMNRLYELLGQAFYQAGHFFTPGPRGLIDHLAEQMSKYGIINVQTQEHVIEFHEDPQALQTSSEDMRKAFQFLAPFIKKWVKFSDDYNALYNQMLEDMRQPDFEQRGVLLTAWGEAFKPDDLGPKRSYF